MPQLALTDDQINACYSVMSELRPHIKEDEFLERIRQQEGEGFKLAYLEDNGQVVAVAGYRISTNLFKGKNLYVDDLVTTGAGRSKGYGEKMISWLKEQTQHENCAYFCLDSGVQREQAHKFYFRHNFTVAGFHFVQDC